MQYRTSLQSTGFTEGRGQDFEKVELINQATPSKSASKPYFKQQHFSCIQCLPDDFKVQVLSKVNDQSSKPGWIERESCEEPRYQGRTKSLLQVLYTIRILVHLSRTPQNLAHTQTFNFINELQRGTVHAVMQPWKFPQWDIHSSICTLFWSNIKNYVSTFQMWLCKNACLVPGDMQPNHVIVVRRYWFLNISS